MVNGKKNLVRDIEVTDGDKSITLVMWNDVAKGITCKVGDMVAVKNVLVRFDEFRGENTLRIYDPELVVVSRFCDC